MAQDRLGAPILFGAALLSASGANPSTAPPAAEEFFIVSSVDTARGTLVLKRPTEVTLSIRVNPKTRCSSENGRAIRVSDLRAGDMVFLAAERDPSGQLVATTIRQGVMTLPELQKRYLRAPPR